MTPEIALVLFVLFVAIILFVMEKFRPDVTAMLVMVSLVLTGLLSPVEAFASFANPAVITVGAVLVISHGLFQTGVADFLGVRILQVAGKSEVRLITAIMVTVGVMSAFMNNIGATAILLPVVLSIGRKTGIAPSKLLIPLSFASLMGGNMTLIGTPPNILASAALQEHLGQGFNFFDFMPMGIIIITSGILYMVLLGRHLLPDRNDSNIQQSYQVQEYMSEIRVLAESPLTGKTPIESRFGEDYDLTIMGVIRDQEGLSNLHRDMRIQANDKLLVKGSLDKIVQVHRQQNLQIVLDGATASGSDLSFQDVTVAEALLDFGSNLAGCTLRDIHFREKYHLTVLALRRHEHLIQLSIQDEPLQPGDILLVQGQRQDLNQLRSSPDFLLLEPVPLETRRLHKATTALLILAALLVIVTMGWLHISIVGVMAALLMVICGVLNMEEVYQAINWKAIFFIAGMLSLGSAMEVTQAAKYLADLIVKGLINWGPIPILLGVYVLTAFLTQLMSNSASTVLMAPIALNIAQDLGAAPQPFLMTVVIAASTIFLTPMGHATNILVFGPGQYKFTDYTKVGVLLMVIHVTLTMSILPYVWPLFP